MFSFLRKRVLKEHMTLVAQNYRAFGYLTVFLPAAVNQQYSAFLEEVGGAWQPGERLSNDAFRHLLAMNADLRRFYDASPAKSVGMKPFDEQFKPLLGWQEYYSRNL
jgi:hypothetical protein